MHRCQHASLHAHVHARFISCRCHDPPLATFLEGRSQGTIRLANVSKIHPDASCPGSTLENFYHTQCLESNPPVSSSMRMRHARACRPTVPRRACKQSRVPMVRQSILFTCALPAHLELCAQVHMYAQTRVGERPRIRAVARHLSILTTHLSRSSVGLHDQ